MLTTISVSSSRPKAGSARPQAPTSPPSRSSRGFVAARFNLANVLKALGRHGDAADGYRLALSLAPDYAEAHSNLGAVLQELGAVDEAIAAYRAALAIRPAFAEAHYNLGTALQEQADHAAGA